MFAYLATSTNIDLSPIADALTSSVNVGQIGTVVGAVIAGGIGLSVFWFGARKLTKSVMSAFKTGKLKF